MNTLSGALNKAKAWGDEKLPQMKEKMKVLLYLLRRHLKQLRLIVVVNSSHLLLIWS